MRSIHQNYIDGRFVPVRGSDEAPLFNPATEEQIGTVRLSNAADVDAAVGAAVAAFAGISTAATSERIEMLHRLSDAVARRSEDLAEAMSEEYGAPAAFVEATSRRSGQVFLDMAKTVETYPWQRRIGFGARRDAPGWCGRRRHALEQQSRLYLLEARHGDSSGHIHRDQAVGNECLADAGARGGPR